MDIVNNEERLDQVRVKLVLSAQTGSNGQHVRVPIPAEAAGRIVGVKDIINTRGNSDKGPPDWVDIKCGY